MSAEVIAPLWMHELVTAQQYDSWSAQQCAGIEIVDGAVETSAPFPVTIDFGAI